MNFTTNRPEESARIQATLEALARGWPGPWPWWEPLARFFGLRARFPRPNTTRIGPTSRALHVEWTDADIVVRGRPSPGVTGLTLLPEGVVHVRVRPLPLNDALTHELVHWALFHLTGNADPDHEAARYGTQWTQAHNDLIKQVDFDLRALRAGNPQQVHT